MVCLNRCVERWREGGGSNFGEMIKRDLCIRKGEGRED